MFIYEGESQQGLPLLDVTVNVTSFLSQYGAFHVKWFTAPNLTSSDFDAQHTSFLHQIYVYKVLV